MIYITFYFLMSLMVMSLLFQTYPQLKKEFGNIPNSEFIILAIMFASSFLWMITIPYVIAVIIFESKQIK